MAKTNKELAVEIAVAFIEANKVVMAAGANGTVKQTEPLSLEKVVEYIKEIYSTLRDLDAVE